MKTLFDTIDDRTIQERFEQFLAQNPHVFALFRRFAEQARQAGKRRYSADALLHRLRWHIDIELQATEGEEFRLNNNYSSRLSRKLVELDPTFEGFFETRKLKAR